MPQQSHRPEARPLESGTDTRLTDFPSLPERQTSVEWLRSVWEQLEPFPNRTDLYSRFIGYCIPYTGTINARVETLRPGFARVVMADRREVQNHLGSVHAIALANLAELTANAALAFGLAPDARFIVTEFAMRYLKKAHGPIVGTCSCEVPTSSERREYPLQVRLTDNANDCVAEASVATLVGPRRS